MVVGLTTLEAGGADAVAGFCCCTTLVLAKSAAARALASASCFAVGRGAAASAACAPGLVVVVCNFPVPVSAAFFAAAAAGFAAAAAAAAAVVVVAWLPAGTLMVVLGSLTRFSVVTPVVLSVVVVFSVIFARFSAGCAACESDPARVWFADAGPELCFAGADDGFACADFKLP